MFLFKAITFFADLKEWCWQAQCKTTKWCSQEQCKQTWTIGLHVSSVLFCFHIHNLTTKGIFCHNSHLSKLLCACYLPCLWKPSSANPDSPRKNVPVPLTLGVGVAQVVRKNCSARWATHAQGPSLCLQKRCSATVGLWRSFVMLPVGHPLAGLESPYWPKSTVQPHLWGPGWPKAPIKAQGTNSATACPSNSIQSSTPQPSEGLRRSQGAEVWTKRSPPPQRPQCPGTTWRPSPPGSTWCERRKHFWHLSDVYVLWTSMTRLKPVIEQEGVSSTPHQVDREASGQLLQCTRSHATKDLNGHVRSSSGQDHTTIRYCCS